MKTFITSIFNLLLLLSTASTHAATKQYNIEMIIFEDTSSRYLNSERWPIIHQPEEDKPAEQPENNSLVNITHHASDALAEYVTKLKNSRQYKVLLHQSWQQTGLSNTDAVDIQIDTSAGENTGNDAESISSNVQGTIKLILGRYLHIHTDLLYNRLNEEYQPASPTLNSKVFNQFQIKSQRRMRSNELHYIDHPLLGILVLVTPIKQPEPAGKN